MPLAANPTRPIYSGHKFWFSHTIASVVGSLNKRLSTEVYGTQVEFCVTHDGKRKFYRDPAQAAGAYESIQ